MWEIVNNQHGEIETLAQNLLNNSQVPEIIQTPLFLILQPSPPHNGEGNGTPLQYSCLENPMDGGPGGL